MENGYLYLKIDDQLLAWNEAGRRSIAIKYLSQHFDIFMSEKSIYLR